MEEGKKRQKIPHIIGGRITLSLWDEREKERNKKSLSKFVDMSKSMSLHAYVKNSTNLHVNYFDRTFLATEKKHTGFGIRFASFHFVHDKVLGILAASLQF